MPVYMRIRSTLNAIFVINMMKKEHSIYLVTTFAMSIYAKVVLLLGYVMLEQIKIIHIYFKNYLIVKILFHIKIQSVYKNIMWM